MAKKLSGEVGLEFPEIKDQDIKSRKAKDFILLPSDKPNCPTVLWFTLSNKAFKEKKIREANGKKSEKLTKFTSGFEEITWPGLNNAFSNAAYALSTLYIAKINTAVFFKHNANPQVYIKIKKKTKIKIKKNRKI